jgi:hypothetical protein
MLFIEINETKPFIFTILWIKKLEIDFKIDKLKLKLLNNKFKLTI